MVPIHIGLISQGGRGWAGGIEYFRNLILGVASLSEAERGKCEISLICPEPVEAEMQEQVRPYLKNLYQLNEALTWPQDLRKRVANKLYQSQYKKTDPRWISFIKEAKFDFLYPLNSGLIGDPFPEQPFVCNWAAWIPDFQHKYLAEYFSQEELVQRDIAFGLIAEHAPTVVVSSKAAESDFHHFYPEATGKTAVLPFRVSLNKSWSKEEPRLIQDKYYLPDRFLIVSNQFWQHKNHIVIFEALRILQQSSIYPDVVFTGHIHDYRRPDYSDFILQTIHTYGISRQVYLLGLVPKSDQIQLMRRAVAVLQPSLFEGWSTVVEDARNLGKPIILSDLGVHLEQSPGSAMYFNRHSPEELARYIAEAWKNLQPGPDAIAEQQAQFNFESDVRIFALRFLQIARMHSSVQ